MTDVINITKVIANATGVAYTEIAKGILDRIATVRVVPKGASKPLTANAVYFVLAYSMACSGYKTGMSAPIPRIIIDGDPTKEEREVDLREALATIGVKRGTDNLGANEVTLSRVLRAYFRSIADEKNVERFLVGSTAFTADWTEGMPSAQPFIGIEHCPRFYRVLMKELMTAYICYQRRDLRTKGTDKPTSFLASFWKTLTKENATVAAEVKAGAEAWLAKNSKPAA